MKVLIINPGATSTKIAVFDEEEQLFKKSIDHSAQELDRFDRVIDQADFRQKAILDAVTEGGFRLTDFAAVCGRGGLYRPIPSGTYAVNDRVMHDVETAPYGEHPSNLGAYLARRIGDMVGIPAFFVDPVCVDEMTPRTRSPSAGRLRRRWADPMSRSTLSSVIWAAACPWRPTTTDGWWTCSTSRTRAPWAWTGPAAFR